MPAFKSQWQLRVSCRTGFSLSNIQAISEIKLKQKGIKTFKGWMGGNRAFRQNCLAAVIAKIHQTNVPARSKNRYALILTVAMLWKKACSIRALLKGYQAVFLRRLRNHSITGGNSERKIITKMTMVKLDLITGMPPKK